LRGAGVAADTGGVSAALQAGLAAAGLGGRGLVLNAAGLSAGSGLGGAAEETACVSGAAEEPWDARETGASGEFGGGVMPLTTIPLATLVSLAATVPSLEAPTTSSPWEPAGAVGEGASGPVEARGSAEAKGSEEARGSEEAGISGISAIEGGGAGAELTAVSRLPD
jgi:hypothetical protein